MPLNLGSSATPLTAPHMKSPALLDQAAATQHSPTHDAVELITPNYGLKGLGHSPAISEKHALALTSCLMLTGAGYWMSKRWVDTPWSGLEYVRHFLPIPSSMSIGGFLAFLVSVILLTFTLKQVRGPLTGQFCPATIWNLRKPNVVLLSTSGLCYLITLALLVGIGYSHYLLVPMVLSVGGIAFSFKRCALASPPRVPLRFYDLVSAGSLFVFALWMSSSDIEHWYFSSIGDEGAFFDWAIRLADSPSLSVFSYTGVYGKFPVADSYYTALFIELFGPSVWAWKYSCSVIQALTAVVVYFLGRIAWNPSAGVSGSILIVVSHYFLAFSKIGYNNTHMCLTSTVVMLLIVLAHQYRSPRLLYVTGVAAGLLTYSIWGGLVILPALALTLLIYCRPWRGLVRSSYPLFLIGFGFACSALPGLLTHSLAEIKGIALGINHGVSPLSDGSDRLVALLSSIIAIFHNDLWGSHYVHGPLVDPITGSLFLIGLVASVMAIRSWQSATMLPWLVLGLVGIVAMSNASSPYLTRLIFLVPPICILAGYGFSTLISIIPTASLRVSAHVMLLLAAGTLNVQQLYLGTPSRTPIYGSRMLVREVQNSTLPRIVYISPGQLTDKNIEKLLTLYAPKGISINATSEEAVRHALEERSISSVIPSESKILTLSKLYPLLNDLARRGLIPGPITTIYAEPGGDNIVTANDPSSQGTLPSPSFVPSLVRDLIGLR